MPYYCSLTSKSTSSIIMAEDIERLPLDTFMLLQDALAVPCGYNEIMTRLDDLDGLRQDRPEGLPRVEIKIEIDVYWVRIPNIEALIFVMGDIE